MVLSVCEAAQSWGKRQLLGSSFHPHHSMHGSTPWPTPELPAPAAGPSGGLETIKAKTSGDRRCSFFGINGKSNWASDCSMADATRTKDMAVSWVCGGNRCGNSKTPEKQRKKQKYKTRAPITGESQASCRASTAGLSSDCWVKLGRVTKAITSSDFLNSSCLQRERALGSDRWSLVSLAALVRDFGRVQPARLCRGPAAAATAEGDRAGTHSPDTAQVGSAALVLSCQRSWVCTETLDTVLGSMAKPW